MADYTLDQSEALSFAIYVAVAILAEAMAIDFRIGSGKPAKSSLAFLPFLAAVVVYPHRLAALLVAIVVTVSQFGLRRNDVTRGVFNVSQGVVAAALSAHTYSLFASVQNRGDISFFGFTLVAAVFFASNLMLSSTALALLRRQPIRSMMHQVAGGKGANLWYDLLASPIALVPAVLYDAYRAGGLIMIVLPLLLIRYSYLGKTQLEGANRDLLKVLVKAIETRDPYTSGHSVRVATLARAIAEDLQLSSRHTEQIETAALLHDIGKIDSVYESVIRKPYDLSPDERELIRTHATKGADLLESLTSVNSEVIRAVRHHHERYDGSGYPSGFKGEEIPIAARIIMLSDSIDAMLSDRPYRKALTIEKTRIELVRCAGTQFDPEIVRAILQFNTLERAAQLADRPIFVSPQSLYHTA
ncbi:MAG: HD-GYP domain-containing protein [Gemmatimonadetes bacterium]|nr:HD-GYP domain-containing protein [Gemmatimonadota bacterium]